MVVIGEGFVVTKIVVAVKEVTVNELELEEDTERELGLEKEVAAEIPVPVVGIEENISTEEVIFNELDLEEDTETKLALDVESIQIDTDEVDISLRLIKITIGNF